MSEPDDDNESCWNNLENYRVKLISVVDPSRITPYLRQCKVINHDDEEQILNDPSLVIRKRKAGKFSIAHSPLALHIASHKKKITVVSPLNRAAIFSTIRLLFPGFFGESHVL